MHGTALSTEAGAVPIPCREAWLCDFEFRAGPGERPGPVCMVARELRSGREVRLWRDELACAPPRTLRHRARRLVRGLLRQRRAGLLPGARLADAGAGARPVRRVPRRNQWLPRPCGAGLVGALAWHGLDAMAADEKAAMRASCCAAGPGHPSERGAVLDYCAGGRRRAGGAAAAHAARDRPGPAPCCGAATWPAAPAWSGPASRSTPPLLSRLRSGWADIKGALVAEVDADFGVYDGLTFKTDRFAACSPRTAFLGRGCRPARWRWTRTPSATWRSAPQLAAAARAAPRAGELRLEALAVGARRPQPLPALAPSARGPGATSRATRGSSSARQRGCAG